MKVYAASKLAGEYFIRAIHERHFIIRTCGLYAIAGSSGKGGNFIEMMLRLASEGKEIRDFCYWYEFAAATFEMAGLHPWLQETTSAAFGARATRPAYSVLDNARLRSLGLDDLRHLRDALKDYLSDRKQVTKEA